MRHALLFALLAAFVAAGPAEAKTKLKIASFVPAFSLAVTKVAQPWVDAIQKEIGDEVEIQTFWGGALGRNASQQLKLVLDGIADVALISPDYTRGKFPQWGVFGLPYFVDSPEEASVAMWRAHSQGLDKGWEGVRPMVIYGTGLVNIHSKVAVKGLEDFNGVKMRAAGPGQVSIAKAIGAVPVFMPSPQMTESLSRGVIGASMVTLGGYFTFKLKDVTTHHVRANLGVTTLSFVMSDKTYAKLSDKAKAAVDRAGGEQLALRAGQAMSEWDNQAKALILKHGHTLIEPTEAQSAAWRAMLRPIHDEWKKSNPDAPAAYDAVSKIIAKIRAGS